MNISDIQGACLAASFLNLKSNLGERDWDES